MTTIQTYADGQGVTTTRTSPEGFFGRLARLITVLVTLTLGALAAIGVLLIGVGVAGLTLVAWIFASAWAAVRRAIRGTREPNGVFDGRRNVRVVERGEAGEQER